MGIDRVEIYLRKRLLDVEPQWRWRYVAAGNSAKLANGGEGYGKLEDCVLAAARVVGFDPHSETNWDLIERFGSTEVFHVQRAGGGLIEVRRTA